MTEPQFKPGDRVRVTIEGTVYTSPAGSAGELYFTYRVDTTDVCLRVHSKSSAVEVEHRAPAEWPPQPGDLWRDKHGDLWFFYIDPSAFGSRSIIGRTAKGGRWSEEDRASEGQLQANAPWSLVHRDPAEDDDEPGIPNECDDCETTGYNCGSHRSRS